MMITKVKAGIIAGGKGIRSKSITGDLIPKALVPVAGEPIVFRQLRLLARYGITKAAMMVRYLADKLQEALPSKADELGLELTFFVEDKPLGTAGCIEMAKEYFSKDNFLILYGDIAAEIDLLQLLKFHQKKQAVATIVSHPNDHPHESDLLRISQDGRILKILPRKNRQNGWYRNLVPAGIYCLSPAVFEYITPGEEQDFIKDIFPAMTDHSAKIYAYNTPEYLCDIGTPERYVMVERDINSGLFNRMNSIHLRPAVFFDRDGVLNRSVPPEDIISPDMLELLPGASEAVRIVNNAGWLSVVITNQPQLAKGFITLDDLECIHGKLETLFGYRGVKLDRIYYCPHHPEKGFDGEISELKTECMCRKPKPGLLNRAASELPILLEESCMIGDSWRDMGAARAAGIYAYGVRTGLGCQDCVGRYQPDLIFDDVAQATRFAVHGFRPATTFADEVKSTIEEHKDIYMIGICGLSCSGKSTFAHALVREFRKWGIETLHIRLDDWIVPKSQRKPGSTAEDRNQTHLYSLLFEKLLAGEVIQTIGYNPATREFFEPITYKYSGEQAVILDGLFACHETIKKKINCNVFIEVDEQLIIKRFFQFYRWKGDSESEIKILLSKIQMDEWPVVRKQRHWADKVITLNEEVMVK